MGALLFFVAVIIPHDPRFPQLKLRLTHSSQLIFETFVFAMAEAATPTAHPAWCVLYGTGIIGFLVLYGIFQVSGWFLLASYVETIDGIA